MTSVIDFNALPATTPIFSIRRTAIIVLTLVVIFVGLAIIIGLVTNNPDIGASPLIGAIVILGALGFVAYQLRLFLRQLQMQSRVMQIFASANGWQYESSGMLSVADLAPPHKYLAYDAA